MDSTRPRFRFVGAFSLLLTLPFLAGADGDGCGGKVAPTGPWAGVDAGPSCVPADCAALAAPADAKVCPGGTSVARTACSADANGQCGWEFPACPLDADAGDGCDCGPDLLGAPNYVCSDGSTAGPVCSRNSGGNCAWQIRSCPSDACPGLGCFPNCPNGVLKDNNGCDTCQCAPADGGVGSTCTRDADCGTGHNICGFPTADACAAVGTCFAAQQVVCNAYSPGCACDGSEVNVACNGLPSGYALAPLRHAGVCTDSGATDGGACCPVGSDLYSCTYPDGGTGSACHNPQLGCESSLTCGQGCDPVVTGRCGP